MTMVKLQVHVHGVVAAAVTAKMRNIEYTKAWFLLRNVEVAVGPGGGGTELSYYFMEW